MPDARLEGRAAAGAVSFAFSDSHTPYPPTRLAIARSARKSAGGGGGGGGGGVWPAGGGYTINIMGDARIRPKGFRRAAARSACGNATIAGEGRLGRAAFPSAHHLRHSLYGSSDQNWPEADPPVLHSRSTRQLPGRGHCATCYCATGRIGSEPANRGPNDECYGRASGLCSMRKAQTPQLLDRNEAAKDRTSPHDSRSDRPLLARSMGLAARTRRGLPVGTASINFATIAPPTRIAKRLRSRPRSSARAWRR